MHRSSTVASGVDVEGRDCLSRPETESIRCELGGLGCRGSPQSLPGDRHAGPMLTAALSHKLNLFQTRYLKSEWSNCWVGRVRSRVGVEA